MHIFQAVKFNCFMPLSTDIVDERFDVSSKLAESTVGIFSVKIVFDLRKNKLSGLFFLERLRISGFFFLLTG